MGTHGLHMWCDVELDCGIVAYWVAFILSQKIEFYFVSKFKNIVAWEKKLTIYCYYRLQMKLRKVMFLHLSVHRGIPQALLRMAPPVKDGTTPKDSICMFTFLEQKITISWCIKIWKFICVRYKNTYMYEVWKTSVKRLFCIKQTM